jgi:hypothetical protein
LPKRGWQDKPTLSPIGVYYHLGSSRRAYHASA